MEENYYYESEPLVDPAIIFTMLAFLGAIVLISIISQWRIFEKAGKPGWAAIIPIYNLYVHLKVVGKPSWWMLLLFIPIVNLFFAIKLTHLLSKSFGKDIGFTLGLLFLPILFLPILAFSSAKYQGPYGDPEAFAAHQESNRFEFENAAY